jgi:hypothetical protein
MAARKEKMAINYVDFEGFKTALVRLTILSSSILGGQEDRMKEVDGKIKDYDHKLKDRVKHNVEKRQRVEKEIMASMRSEYEAKLAIITNTMSKSPNKAARLSSATKADYSLASKTPAAKGKDSKSSKIIAPKPDPKSRGKSAVTTPGLSASNSEENLKKFRRDPTTLVKTEIAKDQYEDKLDERRAEEKFQTWLRHQEVKGTGFKDRVETKLKEKAPKKEPEVDEGKKKLARGARAKVEVKKNEPSSAIQAKSRQTVTQKELQADLKLKRL